MEALKKFDIKYLSASHITKFITNPSDWVLTYIYKMPFKGSAAAEIKLNENRKRII